VVLCKINQNTPFRDQLVQMKHFWLSVMFGPERKLNEITELPEFPLIVENITLWLFEQFSIPVEDWELVKASKNPHSETFVFRQKYDSSFPEKFLIKKYIIQMENGSAVYPDGLEREIEALTKISTHCGRYKVFTPKLYGYNLDLCWAATNFLEGHSFFNSIFENPINVLLGKSNYHEYCESLTNLGLWLKEIHSSKIMYRHQKDTVKNTLEKDLFEIEIRLKHLMEVRPADFSLSLYDRIRSTSSRLMHTIINDNPIPTSVHGDFTLANMLYNSGIVNLLDYATFGLGMPEDDLSRIYLDLINVESYSYSLSPSKKGGLSSSFLTGYGMNMDYNSNTSANFYLIKHCIINIYMYTKHWGNRKFLNPFLCRLFYSFQRKFLLEILGP